MFFLQIALTSFVAFFLSAHQIRHGIAAAVAAQLRGEEPKLPRVAIMTHIIAQWVGTISALAFVWSLPNWF